MNRVMFQSPDQTMQTDWALKKQQPVKGRD